MDGVSYPTVTDTRKLARPVNTSAFFRTDQFSSTSIRALGCSHQLRLYFRFCPSFGSGKWRRWNGAKSTASFAKDMFPNQPTHYCASQLLMRTISNDQTVIGRGCACSSERVLRQGFSG